MARPKTGKPKKKSLTLTVDEQTRENLRSLSQDHQKSISKLVSEWADEKKNEIDQGKQLKK